MNPELNRHGLRAGLVAALAVAGIAAAGCAGSGTHPAAGSTNGSQPSSSAPPASRTTGQNVTIEGMNTLKFAPATISVHPGSVRITLKDMGAYPHNIVIPALHVTSPTVTGDPGGTSVSFTVTFPHSGHYAFHCQYHQSAGMTGVFVVS